ncbi:MAG: hypothetical protein PHN59_06440, partial [Candidatus Omnitrophica bacterium]|nr:hypothetical protein [Candidatus Omnitrophota bacterium]
EDRPLELSCAEANKLGIEAKVGRENDYFVYELKLPIAKTPKHPHAIEVKPGRPFGLGLEIEGRGVKVQQGMFEGADLFQLWMTIKLAPEQTGG